MVRFFEIVFFVSYSKFPTVPKYDSLSFFITDPKELHNLEILTVNYRKNIYNHTTVVGHELTELKDFEIPSQEYKGFLEISSTDFQQNIHELFQTATVVTFATNFKVLKMFF